MKIKRTDIYYVYIVRCKKDTLYAGYTKDIEKRVKAHNEGHGAKYLKGRVPVELVYVKEYRYYKNALRAEKRIKKLTRRRKGELIRIYGENNI